MRLQTYTDQQARFDKAFCHGGTCCSTTCEACGRTYFVTSPGHGDYEEGELDRYRQLAAEQPDKYIEVPDFGSVSDVVLNGKNLVIGCICDPTKPWSEWIECHARDMTDYLRLYWKSQWEDAGLKAKEAREAILNLAPQDGKGEWALMDTAPKNAKWVEVLLRDGKSTMLAHWASNLSGEEQPPFEGWFYEKVVGSAKGGCYMPLPSAPIAWRPEPRTAS